MKELDLDIDFGEEKEVGGDSLKRAKALGQAMLDQGSVVELLTEELKRQTEIYREIEMVTLPDLMTEIELESFTLKDGTKIEVNREFSCSMTKAKAPSCLSWIIKHNFGGIIKTNINLKFGKEELAQAQALEKDLRKRYDDVELKQAVHHSTLKSFIGERLEEGFKNFPLELFSVHQYNKAKLTLPKKPRKGK